MGRKSRRKRERRGEGPEKEIRVEREQVWPIVVERAGRHVLIRSLLNEAGAAQMRQHFRDSLPRIRTEMQAAIDEVATICSRVNPFELLAVSSFANCFHDPETYTESTFEGREAHAEYLLSVILSIKEPAFVQHAEESDYKRVKELVGTIFDMTLQAFDSGNLDESRLMDPITDLRAALFSANLLVRGHSFQEHHVDLARAVFSPHDAFFRKHFGVSASACIAGMVEVANQIGRRFTELIASWGALREILHGCGGLPDPAAVRDGTVALSPDQERLFAKAREVCAVMAPEAPYEVVPGEKVPEAYLERVSCLWGDNSAFLIEGKWAGWPSNTSIITAKPIIRHVGKYYAFVPQLLDRHTFETFEGWIRDADAGYFDRSYQRARGKVLENLALGYLAAMLPGCRSYGQLHYVIERAGASEPGEVDGLVIFDTVVFIIEAKAGLFTPPAKRGGEERIRKHIAELIDKAYEQGKRTLDYIKSKDEVTFRDGRGGDVVTLRANDYERFYLVNVTLDCQEPILTQLNSLRAMAFLRGRDWPWTIFINDLRVISEIIESPCEFLLYLDRRIRANDVPEFSVFDELDYLMHFLKHGLFLEKLNRGENLHYGLTGYTEALDRYYDFLAGRVSSGEKPRLAIPERMRSFVQKIEKCGCHGFAGVGARLLMYAYEEQMHVVGQIDRIISACLRDCRDHDITLASRQNHGVSIIASQEAEATLWPRLEDFGRLRQYETKAHTWDVVVLSVMPSGDYTVSVRVLRGVPTSSPELDGRVQEQRDRRFRRSVSNGPRPGRNDPCPCGSGKKIKRCHGA